MSTRSLIAGIAIGAAGALGLERVVDKYFVAHPTLPSQPAIVAQAPVVPVRKPNKNQGDSSSKVPEAKSPVNSYVSRGYCSNPLKAPFNRWDVDGRNEVDFWADCAVGAKAYAVVDNKIIELEKKYAQVNFVTFNLPEDLNRPQLEIYAVDRSGRKSDMITLFYADGIYSDKPFASSTIAPTLTVSSNDIHLYDDDVRYARLFVKRKQKEIELKDGFVANRNAVLFDIPEGLLENDGPFIAYATDRDGNKSQEFPFYVLEKLVSDKPLGCK